MKRLIVLLLGIVMVAATACGASTGLSAEKQEIAAYLSSMYRIQGDLMAATAPLMPSGDDLEASSEEDLVEQQRDAAEQLDVLFKQYVDDLAAIEPPPGAVESHAALIASTERIAAETKRILDDLASGDPTVAAEAQQDQAALLQEVLADNQGLQEELAGMVTEVLADRDDPESVYILELLALRTSGALEGVSDLLGDLETAQPSTPEDVKALIDQAVGVFESLRADYAAITPPDRWADVHAEQIAFLDDGIALYARFGEILVPLFEDPESIDPAEFEQLIKDLVDWAAQGPALNAAFAYQLADYFEELS